MTLGVEFKVLDKGFVELQDAMGSDSDIVSAARTSFLGESKGDAADKKLLFYLMQHGHTSPFEHVVFKFRIKAPLVVWWQLVRHRTWSFNLQSGRYMEFEPDEFYIPAVWRLQSKDNKQGSEGELSRLDSYGWSSALDDHAQDSMQFYQDALQAGIAKEMARFFLPAFCLYYTGVCTVDAHNLMHFLKLRMDFHSQWEIQQYAICIYEKFFKPLLPWTAEAFEKFQIN